MKTSDEVKGKQLLSAVERLVSSNETLRTHVAVCEARAKARAPEASKSKDTLRQLVAQELTRSYSNRAAIAGGATALPALIPGVGSLAAGIAGTFAELAYLLKTEVELCLSISHVYGFDIDEPQERQLSFLLAAVSTYDASGKNFFVDVVRAEGVAIWNYGSRVLARMVIKAMTALALAYVWRGLLRMVPVLGIVIGSGMNKVLTERVGERASRDLRTRRDLMKVKAPTAVPAPKKKKLAAKKKPAKKPKLAVVSS
ncbi:MAG: EcsC family protein [Archangium sp.]|nr:EcsC family protein [Archangium sp.]